MSEKDNKLDGPNKDSRPKNIIEWMNDRHITVIISGIIMIVIAERLIQGIGGDCIAPAFRNLTKNWRVNGKEMTQNEKCMWNKVFWHILEFAIAILGIYLVTKYIFKHRKRNVDDKENKTPPLKPGHVRASTSGNVPIQKNQNSNSNSNLNFPSAGVSSTYFYTLQQ